MDTQETNAQQDPKGESWYSRMMQAITKMGDQLELAGEKRDDFRAFVEMVAREQFKAGNRSGIIWLRKQIGPTPAA